MITITEESELAAWLGTNEIDADLAALIKDTAELAGERSLWGLTCLIVLEPNDGPDNLIAVLGGLPGTERWGEGEAFASDWARVDRQGTWLRLLHTAGDSGFAYVVFAGDAWWQGACLPLPGTG